MQLPASHTLEVLPTELANNMLRRALGSAAPFALQPRRHGVDFVLCQSDPVFTVDVAFFAVEVGGFFEFVVFHFSFCVEGLEAVGVCAGVGFEGGEGGGHFGWRMDGVGFGVVWFWVLVWLVVGGWMDDCWMSFGSVMM
jgi:hypothetical protein